MFEKEAEEYGLQQALWCSSECGDLRDAFKEGAEVGYNKAKVEVEDSYRESLCNSELNLASVTEQLEYAKTIIKDLLDNSDEYARQRAIDFLEEKK